MSRGAAGVIVWGPVGVWAGAVATFLVAVTALAVAAGFFDRFRVPAVQISFDQTQPWCRSAPDRLDGDVLWVRVGVENVRREPARGCVGRMIGIATDGVARSDIDPIQLRWAGIPRSRSFDPVDLRRGQREFIDVVSLRRGSQWQLVTFDDEDFEPGFPTEFPADRHHVLQIAIFSDNADTVVRSLSIDGGECGTSPSLRLGRVS